MSRDVGGMLSWIPTYVFVEGGFLKSHVIDSYQIKIDINVACVQFAFSSSHSA